MRSPFPVLSLVLAACLLALPVAAWENHTILTDLALASEPWGGASVDVESLDAFLAAEAPGLQQVLSEVEVGAKADFPAYEGLPASLAFDPRARGAALRASFVGAIRVNPRFPFALFLQTPMGQVCGRAEIPQGEVDLSNARIANPPLRRLEPGESVTALQVVDTAADEPDYGMDIGLFEDNGTDYGKTYGFGKQPFGNPSLSYGSQAPFHMSFANESWILKAAAPGYQRSYVGYRVELYSALARAAFASGHGYWGWRFAGWALHYVEDAAQPYHSSILPSQSTMGILGLYLFGPQSRIDGTVILLSNRHTVLENYEYSLFASPEGEKGSPGLYAALRGAVATSVFGDPRARRWVLDKVAKKARSRGRTLDRAIASAFDPKYVDDPAFDYGAWQADHDNAYDPHAALVAGGSKGVIALETALAPSLADLGEAAREFMKSFAAGSAR